MTIKEKHLIVKQNKLNEFRPNDMSLYELRFFSIYLSKINSQDITTRVVKFPITDFFKIMNLEQPRASYIKEIVSNLLKKIVHIPLDNGGFRAFQLFKRCRVDQDKKTGEWYIEIDAHDDALPLMFDFKTHYFKYELWNALNLKGKNQFRMYEILKQYESIGERIVSVDDLKHFLGIGENEYKRWDNFKKDVLEVCRKSIEKNTDIKFTYEPSGKKGRGGKILSLKFTIIKNKNFKNKINLDQFISTHARNGMDVKREKKSDPLDESEIDRINSQQNSSESKAVKRKINHILEKYDITNLSELQIKNLNAVLKGNLQVLEEKCKLLKESSGVRNPVNWLIAAIKNDFKTPFNNKDKIKSKFNNFKGYPMDYDALELLNLYRLHGGKNPDGTPIFTTKQLEFLEKRVLNNAYVDPDGYDGSDIFNS